MKRLAGAFTISAVLISGCHTPDPGDGDTPAPEVAESDAGLVGAYVPSKADDPAVVAAERFAIEELYKAHPTRMLAEIASREIQVVAGLNHRFRIGMGGGNGNFRKMYEVVVYQPLDGALEVTRIEEIDLPD